MRIIKELLFIVFILSVIAGLVVCVVNSNHTPVNKQVFADHRGSGCSTNHWVCM